MLATSSTPVTELSFSRGRRLALEPGRPRIVGIVNVTPDSFSDGGQFLAAERAVAHGLALVAEGADLLDLGAESTRPGGGVYGAGARTVPVEEELERLLPVLSGLRRKTDTPISIDTRKAAVARQALGAGADLINDVSALADPEMAEVVAEAGCPLILMHSRGELSSMQRGIAFTDVVAEVAVELEATARRAVAAGIAADRVIVDPGLGFGKTSEQNFALLARLPELVAAGRPVLVGASRKSFLGAVTGQPPADRLEGSLAAAGWAARGGAALVRVHDVAATRRFLDVWFALEEACS
jgi:dihydropteroate synthase